MANDPTNAATQEQFNVFFKKAVMKAKNPDPREQVRKLRQKRAEKIKTKFGL